MTTKPSTDTFETVQHFDQWTEAAVAVMLHVKAEKEAGIDGPRGYVLESRHGCTDWTIESYPADPRAARKQGVFYQGNDGTTPRIHLFGHDVYDFPCCGPNGEGHEA